MAHDKIKQLLAQGSLKQLVAGVDVSFGLVDDLKSTLKKSEDSGDVSKWMESLNKLEKQTIPKRTVVGVFGNTGAGKSSLINAVLGEESLVPTNCMRACTSAVTELLWNDNEDPQKRYMAEIQFITADDWTTELRVLFGDLAESGGDLAALSNSDSEAGVALAKIRAVYPDEDDHVLMQGPQVVDKLVRMASVKEVLGTTKCFYAASAQSLVQQLQPFVDSKQRDLESDGYGQETSGMAAWPLIKVVRIFTRAPVLEAGLVLVDLPGLQDSNAARAAVAEKYKEQCSGYWIAAPITRGVDDKTAQNLMGDSFKRQLQLDGGISNVTIIYTKSDDISVTEALKDVHGGWKKDVDSLQAKIHRAETLMKNKAAAINELKSSIKAAEVAQAENTTRLRDADRRMTALDTGLRETPRKRRLSHGALPEAKRAAFASDADMKVSPQTPEPYIQTEEGSQDVDQQPDVIADLEDPQEENERRRQTLDALKKQLRALEKEKKELKPEIDGLKTQLKKQCITFRNSFSRTRAKEQFISGIKEMDDERAMELDEDNFDADKDQRDYNALKQQLHVFCVSSRAYLKLSGKLSDDEAVSGFETEDDTEIPQLQRLATDLAETMTAAGCRQYLSEMSQQLRSMALRLVASDDPLSLAAKEKRRENRNLTKNLDILRKDFERAEKDLFASMNQAEEYVLATLTFTNEFCGEQVSLQVSKWFDTIKNGGMSSATFKLVCRGGGIHQKKNINLHSDLIRPFNKQVSKCWEDVFGKNIFSALTTFGQAAAKMLEDFRSNMEGRDVLSQSDNSVTAFSELVVGYEEVLRDISRHRKGIQESQRSAIRVVLPIIAGVMTPLYPLCLNETGAGSYKRIKELVKSHVAGNSDMYKTAGDEVQTRIKGLIANLKKTIHAKDEHILDDIRGRYSELVKGKTRISKSLRETLAQLRDVLAHAETLYEGILVSEGRIGPGEAAPQVVKAEFGAIFDDEGKN